jgi:cytochrome d ubiquinol oxidase subunit II
VAGLLALAGLLVIRAEAASLWHGLSSGLGLALVVVSTLAGVVTMVLVWLGHFGLARASAALAVAAVIAGWAAAQEPQVLPGLTVQEAAAGRETLIATIVSVAAGAVILVPSLAVLYSLVLRGRLDAPEAVNEPEGAGALEGAGTSEGAGARGGAAAPEAVGSVRAVRGDGAARGGGTARGGGAARGDGAGRGRLGGAFAVVTLVAGAGLLVFADPAWAHAIGALALVACAVTVFALASSPPESAEPPGPSRS